MKTFILTALLFVSAISGASADTFNHYHLWAADGTPVTIDFQKTSDFLPNGSSRGFASPVYFNIGNSISPNSDVKVEIAFYNICSYRCSGDTTMRRDYNQYDRTLTATVQQNGQASAKTDSLIVSLGSGNGSYRYLQKIRVTIDGVALIDSVSRTQWFTVELNGNNN